METLDESRRINEKDLARHLDNADEQAAVDGQASDGLITRDNQLYEALTLLKGINVFAPQMKPSLPAGQQTAEATSGSGNGS